MTDRDPNEGARFSIGGGEFLTVNSTDDPSVPGGWYQTTTNDGGDKSTAVYDANGDIPSGAGNNDDYS
jgi:hypothetical protein